MSSEILGTGIAFPLSVDRRGGLSLAHAETDVEQAIQIILGTAPGERPMRPEFGCGVHDYVFDTIDPRATGFMELAVRSALERWEPRIEVLAVRFDLAEHFKGKLNIEIDYRILATNQLRNLVYPFYLIPAEESE